MLCIINELNLLLKHEKNFMKYPRNILEYELRMFLSKCEIFLKLSILK